ncbi:MAG: sensor histidine kinase [Clostridiaceae bacterium]|jgi:two-component system sensor histidine kinase YesM|nr:sensor histidine kinase [Clostridiaceae bacterium]
MRAFDKIGEKLVRKLILIFTLIIVTIVVSLTFISYKIIEQESFNNIIFSNESNLKLVNKNFEKYFSDIDQVSFPYANYNSLINAVNHDAEDYNQQVYLENYVRNLIYQRTDICGVFLYVIKEGKYYYIARDNNDFKVNTIFNKEILKEEWYTKLLHSTSNTYIQTLFPPSNTGYVIKDNTAFIAYHRVLRNIQDKEPSAVISLYFNFQQRNDILSSIPRSSGENIMLLNSQNDIFYVDNKELLNQMEVESFFKQISSDKSYNYFYFKVNKDKYLVMYDISSENKWKLVKFIPYGQISKAAEINKNISLVISMVFLIFSVFIVIIISNSITKPLKKLSRNMNRFGKGELNIQTEIKGRDEIAQLSKQFNDMVLKINELINEQYKMKLVEKNAILKALEAELNPHFLYNALQAISTKALKSGFEDISVMVDALALTFRYCINGGDIVTAGEEIKHVENYLIIQKARYGERLQVIYELEEEALSIKIPKMSIQCLVENSIKYALEESAIVCIILIKVTFEGEKAKIVVKDNGKGISEERLKEIQQYLNSEWIDGENKCIGLKNLSLRLKLIFGQSSEMLINSDSRGTEISIVIPKGDKV